MLIMCQPFWIYSHPHGVRCGGWGGHHLPFSFHGSWAVSSMVEMMPKTGSENFWHTTVKHIVSMYDFILYIHHQPGMYINSCCVKILMVVKSKNVNPWVKHGQAAAPTQQKLQEHVPGLSRWFNLVWMVYISLILQALVSNDSIGGSKPWTRRHCRYPVLMSASS